MTEEMSERDAALLAKCEELLIWLHERDDSPKLRGLIDDIEALRDRLLGQQGPLPR